jgi:hypothetical protein
LDLFGAQSLFLQKEAKGEQLLSFTGAGVIYLNRELLFSVLNIKGEQE